MPRKIGLSIGGKVTTANVRAHRNLEQLVDERADQILSLLAKSPAKIGVNGHRLAKLSNIIKQQNNIQNRSDILSKELQELGILSEDEQLKILLGHRKKLPQRRRVNTKEFFGGANASVIKSKLGITGEARILKKTSNEYDREPIFTSLQKRPEFLEKKIQQHTSDSLNQLRTEKNKPINERALNARNHREAVKKEILANLDVLQQYTSHTRAKDSTYNNSLSTAEAMMRKSLGRLPNNVDIVKKKAIEGQLNTKGRTETIERLTVRHAALVQLYEESMSNELTKPVENSKHDINERQFKKALNNINELFRSPNITMSKKTLDALHTSTRVINTEVEGIGTLDLSAFGQGITLQVSHGKAKHSDPVKSGHSTTLVLMANGALTHSSIKSIIEEIRSKPAEGMSEPVSEEAAQEMEKSLLQAIDGGAIGKLGVEVMLWKGKVSHLNVFSEQTLEIGADLSLAGGAAAKARTTQRNTLINKMGKNSFHHLHLHFNNHLSAKTIDPSGKTYDEFSKSADKYSETLLASHFRKLQNPNSEPSKYLQDLINENEELYKPEDLRKIKNALASLRQHSKGLMEDNVKNNEVKKNPNYLAAVNDLRDIFYIYNTNIIAAGKKANSEFMGN